MSYNEIITILTSEPSSNEWRSMDNANRVHGQIAVRFYNGDNIETLYNESLENLKSKISIYEYAVETNTLHYYSDDDEDEDYLNF